MDKNHEEQVVPDRVYLLVGMAFNHKHKIYYCKSYKYIGDLSSGGFSTKRIHFWKAGLWFPNRAEAPGALQCHSWGNFQGKHADLMQQQPHFESEVAHSFNMRWYCIPFDEIFAKLGGSCD